MESIVVHDISDEVFSTITSPFGQVLLFVLFVFVWQLPLYFVWTTSCECDLLSLVNFAVICLNALNVYGLLFK